jgi:hypothetical protein
VADLPAIRARLAHYQHPTHHGNVTAQAYREDVGALLDYVERTRALVLAADALRHDARITLDMLGKPGGQQAGGPPLYAPPSVLKRIVRELAEAMDLAAAQGGDRG